MCEGETAQDSWDFTAEAGRLGLAVGWALMKERLMKEASERCLPHMQAAEPRVGGGLRSRSGVCGAEVVLLDVNHSLKRRLRAFKVWRLAFFPP